MLGIPLRYLLQHPMSGVAYLAADPRQALTIVYEYYSYARERHRPDCRYESDNNWEHWLHDRLGVAWPCHLTVEFMDLWAEVISELEAKGIQPGPKSFQNWNDSDAALARAIWCLTNHLKPKVVVETGVAHGVTSRFILEALAKHSDGHLWSIDLPPMEKHWQEQVGMAVGDHHADRWSYIKGPSRLRLPKLLSQIGRIDLFIHDSLHSTRNVRFEMDRAWAALKPGGALVVDDIDANWGFRSFLEAFPGRQSVICEAEPLRIDDRRFNMKGLFGIILKEATAAPTVRAKGAGAN
jgi:hypothetical protein